MSQPTSPTSGLEAAANRLLTCASKATQRMSPTASARDATASLAIALTDGAGKRYPFSHIRSRVEILLAGLEELEALKALEERDAPRPTFTRVVAFLHGESASAVKALRRRIENALASYAAVRGSSGELRRPSSAAVRRVAV